MMHSFSGLSNAIHLVSQNETCLPAKFGNFGEFFTFNCHFSEQSSFHNPMFCFCCHVLKLSQNGAFEAEANRTLRMEEPQNLLQYDASPVDWHLRKVLYSTQHYDRRGDQIMRSDLQKNQISNKKGWRGAIRELKKGKAVCQQKHEHCLLCVL